METISDVDVPHPTVANALISPQIGLYIIYSLLTFLVIIFGSLLPFVSYIPGMVKIRQLMLAYGPLPEDFIEYVQLVFGEKITSHVPRMPRNLKAQIKSKTEVSLLWSASYSAVKEYAHKEEYVVETCMDGKWLQAACVNEFTQCVVDGLKPGSDFQIRVFARNELGQSAPTPPVSGTTFMPLNSMDGANMDGYQWGQSTQEVYVKIPLKKKVRAAEISIRLLPLQLTIEISGKIVLKGSLCGTSSPNDILWDLEDIEDENDNVKMKDHSGQQLSIIIPKLVDRINWCNLFEGEPKIDVKDIVYQCKYLGTWKGDLGVKGI